MPRLHIIGETVTIGNDDAMPEWARGQKATVVQSSLSNAGMKYDLTIKLPPPSTMIKFAEGGFDLVPRHNDLFGIDSRYIEE